MFSVRYTGMNVLPCMITAEAGAPLPASGDPDGAPRGSARSELEGPYRSARSGLCARIGEHRIALPAEVDPGLVGDKLELGIRPEHIAVRGGDAGVPLGVTAVEDHGRFRIVSARLDDRPVKLRLGPAAADEAHPPVVGQTLHVEFPPGRICLYRDGRIVAPAPRTAREGAA